MGGIDKYALGGNGWFIPYNLLNEKLWYTWKETHFCMLCGVILHCQGVGDDSSVPSCWWESSNSGLSHGSSLDSRKKELLPVNKKEAHAPERQPIYRQIVDSLGMVVACLYSLGNSLGERFNLEVLERVKAYKDPIIYLLVEILHIILSHQEKKIEKVGLYSKCFHVGDKDFFQNVSLLPRMLLWGKWVSHVLISLSYLGL